MDFLPNWQISEATTLLHLEQEEDVYRRCHLPNALWHRSSTTVRPLGFFDKGEGSQLSQDSECEEDEDDEEDEVDDSEGDS